MFEKFKKVLFLKKDLDGLEDYIKDFVSNFDGILRKTLSDTLLAGGKRIRPALFFICAKNEKYDVKYLTPAAAAIEILHTASLIHDDIIDNSLLRRGKKTIHNVYDKDTARHVGDYLFTYSFYLLNRYHDNRILKEISETSKLLVIGEFDQIKTKKILWQSEDVYLEKINKKTSSLFKLSCVLGGLLSGSSDSDIENMRKFGSYLGIAFQINDDLIDVSMDKSGHKFDKPIGNDIKQGNVTLPLIYALKNTKFKEKIRDVFYANTGNTVINDKIAHNIISLINETGAVEMVRQKIYFYLNKARKVTKLIHGSERKSGLAEICDFLLSSVEKTK
ncbi:MAG: polyprenyl synthetase family protein [Actinomycetota bacterium]|nr:polyprenyl synthetase family protein [Actinomycetota bacterium]